MPLPLRHASPTSSGVPRMLRALSFLIFCLFRRFKPGCVLLTSAAPRFLNKQTPSRDAQSAAAPRCSDLLPPARRHDPDPLPRDPGPLAVRDLLSSWVRGPSGWRPAGACGSGQPLCVSGISADWLAAPFLAVGFTTGGYRSGRVMAARNCPVVRRLCDRHQRGALEQEECGVAAVPGRPTSVRYVSPCSSAPLNARPHAGERRLDSVSDLQVYRDGS